MKKKIVINIYEKPNLCGYLISVFASANEIAALILYFAKLISEFKKPGKYCKYFCLLYKNFMSKQRIPPFLNNPSL